MPAMSIALSNSLKFTTNVERNFYQQKIYEEKKKKNQKTLAGKKKPAKQKI